MIEQGDHVLAEASAQNAGMLRRLVTNAHERALARRTQARLEEWQRDGHPDWRERPPFRRTGAVIALEHDSPRLEAAVADLRAAGVDIEEPAAAERARIAPALRDARLARTYWLPADGVCDAWSLGQGLLRGAARHGATLVTARRANGLVVRAGRVVGVSTERGEHEADLVVVCTGAWAVELAASAGLVRPCVPRARHLFQSAPHPCAAGPHPWCWIDDAGLYLRPEAGGFLLSPCDETDEWPAPGPGSRRPPRDAARELLSEKLLRLLPALGELALASGWVGYRSFTPTREALFGPDPELPGLAWLVGLGGSGVSTCLALGEDTVRALGLG